MVRDLERAAAFEDERKVMAAYSETAKTYTQLSLGALVLSVTFYEKVLGHNGPIPADPFLVLAWLSWLAAAVAGAFYQYFAVRFLEARGEAWGLLQRGGHPQLLGRLAQHPWMVYGFLLATFSLGALFFLIVGVARLLG